MGHIDEIGLAVTHVDDEGYLWFDGVGGWTPSVLVGQRIRILAKDGPIVGVIGKKATHLLDEEERKKPIKLDQLWIDIGANDGDDARALVRPGDLAVIEQPVVELANGRLASRAMDNRTGAFVAAEAARLYAESTGAWRFVGVASVAEEISFAGAHTSAFSIAPQAAIAIDVTHTSDYPSVTKNKIGDIRLGGGPVIERGSGVHPAFAEMVGEVAAAEKHPAPVRRVCREHVDRCRRRPPLARRRGDVPRQRPEPLHALAQRGHRAGRPRGHGRARGRRGAPPGRRTGLRVAPRTIRAVQRRLRIVALVSGTVMVVSIALYGRAHSDSLRRADLAAPIALANASPPRRCASRRWAAAPSTWPGCGGGRS